MFRAEVELAPEADELRGSKSFEQIEQFDLVHHATSPTPHPHQGPGARQAGEPCSSLRHVAFVPTNAFDG